MIITRKVWGFWLLENVAYVVPKLRGSTRIFVDVPFQEVSENFTEAESPMVLHE